MIIVKPGLLRDITDMKSTLLKIIDFSNRLLIGKLNVSAEITLDTGTTQTQFKDSRLSISSFVQLMPLTSNAKTMMANIWFSDQSNGVITINHTSSANTDLNYKILIIG